MSGIDKEKISWHCPLQTPSSFLALHLFLFPSCSVLFMFLFPSCSVLFLFLFPSCSVLFMFLFPSCSVLFLFLFPSCSLFLLLDCLFIWHYCSLSEWQSALFICRLGFRNCYVLLAAVVAVVTAVMPALPYLGNVLCCKRNLSLRKTNFIVQTFKLIRHCTLAAVNLYKACTD